MNFEGVVGGIIGWELAWYLAHKLQPKYFVNKWKFGDNQ